MVGDTAEDRGGHAQSRVIDVLSLVANPSFSYHKKMFQVYGYVLLSAKYELRKVGERRGRRAGCG